MGYTASELRQIAGMIDAETRRRDLARQRERLERDVERGVRIVREPRDVNLHRPDAVTISGPVVVETPLGNVYEDFACRTEGCDNRANARYDRGPYYRLCYETCIPARRDEISADQVERRAQTRRPTPPPPTTEPSFTDLADAFERARRWRDDADDGYAAAAEALLEHPLGRELLDLAESGALSPS